jgi:hypothetical protein
MTTFWGYKMNSIEFAPKCIFLLIATTLHYQLNRFIIDGFSGYFAAYIVRSSIYSTTTISNSISVVVFSLLSAVYAFFVVSVTGVRLQWNFLLLDAMNGVLLGLSLTGTVVLVSGVVVFLFKDKVNKNPWLLLDFVYLKSISRTFLWFPVVLLQSSCEEIVFRVCVIDYLSKFGVTLAVITSSCLFVLTEVHFAKTKANSIFPILSSSIIGLIHGYLYSVVHSVVPFIVSRVAIYFLVF